MNPNQSNPNQKRSRRSKFTRKETEDLLNIWGTPEMQLEMKTTYRNFHLWEKICQAMNEKGHNCTALQCKNKIQNLISDYRGKVAKDEDQMFVYEKLASVLGQPEDLDDDEGDNDDDDDNQQEEDYDPSIDMAALSPEICLTEGTSTFSVDPCSSSPSEDSLFVQENSSTSSATIKMEVASGSLMNHEPVDNIPVDNSTNNYAPSNMEELAHSFSGVKNAFSPSESWTHHHSSGFGTKKKTTEKIEQSSSSKRARVESNTTSSKFNIEQVMKMKDTLDKLAIIYKERLSAERERNELVEKMMECFMQFFEQMLVILFDNNNM